MSSGSNKSDIDFIKPLYAVANFMVMVPPKDADKSRLTKHKCYSVLVTLVIICAHGFFMLDVVNVGIPSDMATMVVLNVLHFTLSTTLIAVAILISSFWNIKEFKTFIQGLNEIDRYFEDNYKSSKQFVLELLLIQLIYICIVVFDIYNATSTNELYFYCKTIFTGIERYFITLLVLLIYSYCRVLKLRFKKFNSQLQKFLITPATKKNCEINSFMHAPFKNSTSKKTFNTIGEARKMYNQLTNLTKLIGRLFGWQMLFFFAIIAVGLLEVVDAILLKYFDMNGNIVEILLITTFAIMGIVVAVTCDMTMKEARRTATVCYNLLLEIPTASANVQNSVIRDELNLLAQQAVYEGTHFSAAGFFTIDYTVLFGLLGTVTSYAIVLLQLNE